MDPERPFNDLDNPFALKDDSSSLSVFNPCFIRGSNTVISAHL